MKLYRYRKIKSALRDIKEGTFYFSSSEELNDPIEDYFRVYWKGDKAAWEGLFCNYIYSLNQAIILYQLTAETNDLLHRTVLRDIHKYDNLPLGKVLGELKESFLQYDDIQKIVDFYGDNTIIVNERELCFILRFIHHKALSLCIQKGIETDTIPSDIASKMLEMLSGFNERHFPFDELEQYKENGEERNLIIKVVSDAIEDYHEYQYLRIGFDKEHFLYSHENTSLDSKGAVDENTRKRNWMEITVDYPIMYIKQIKELIYPKSYVTCFSPSGSDSAMWGNYADNHRGVCFIYDTSDNVFLYLKGEEGNVTLPIKPVQYGGDLIECNFFESLGLMNLPQIESWLTGTDGVSCYYKYYTVNEEEWRTKYWNIIDSKPYRKTEDWAREKELRAVLPPVFHDYSEKNSRKLKFDPALLKGVIFGINSSEFDKKCIFEELLQKGFKDIKFYQAEYDEISQCIRIRQKVGWKLEMSD